MTPTQRIEEAARAMSPGAFSPQTDPKIYTEEGMAELRQNALERAARGLAAAYPELHGDKPTAWLAPIEIDRAMYDAYVCALRPDASGNMLKCSRRDKAKRRYAAMRSAYLNTQEQG